MKLSTILFPLALVLGLASATGIEKDASLKAALRRRLEDASRSEEKVSSSYQRHIVVPPLTRLTRCTVLFFGVGGK